jgi:hypothetical protein
MDIHHSLNLADIFAGGECLSNLRPDQNNSYQLVLNLQNASYILG